MSVVAASAAASEYEGIMIFRKLAMAAALSLATVSTGAVAQSAQPLSLANAPGAARTGVDMRGESHIRGGFIIPTLIVIALAIGIWQLTKSDSSSP
jgi:hypothetical protein